MDVLGRAWPGLEFTLPTAIAPLMEDRWADVGWSSVISWVRKRVRIHTAHFFYFIAALGEFSGIRVIYISIGNL